MRHLKTFNQLNESITQMDRAVEARVRNGYVLDEVEDIRMAVLNKLQSEPGADKIDMGYSWHVMADYAMRELADEFFSSDMNRNDITDMANSVREDDGQIILLRQGDFDYDNEQGYYIFAGEKGEDLDGFKARLLDNIKKADFSSIVQEES